MRVTSGLIILNCSIASLPLEASPASCMSVWFAMRAATPSRISGWSSTERIRIVVLCELMELSPLPGTWDSNCGGRVVFGKRLRLGLSAQLLFLHELCSRPVTSPRNSRHALSCPEVPNDRADFHAQELGDQCPIRRPEFEDRVLGDHTKAPLQRCAHSHDGRRSGGLPARFYTLHRARPGPRGVVCPRLQLCRSRFAHPAGSADRVPRPKTSGRPQDRCVPTPKPANPAPQRGPLKAPGPLYQGPPQARVGRLHLD